MTSTERRKNEIAEIAKRVALRKASPNLRHIPNENDVNIVSEHTRLMVYHQYMSIATHEEDDS